jgi:sigma-E factor negative regulatory protein RseC
MKGEIFRQEGIVLREDGDTAEVRLVSSDHCETCGAKELCRTGSDDDARSLTVATLPGLLPGDRVQIEVSGGSLLLASGLLYGVPLLLLVAGILAGSLLAGEIAAALLGLALPTLYALGMVGYTKLRPKQAVRANPVARCGFPQAGIAQKDQ